MICYVVSFCLRLQLEPPYACGVWAYATHLEVLLTPPAYATLRAWSCSFRAGRYDMTLTKHVQGGFGRRSVAIPSPAPSRWLGWRCLLGLITFQMLPFPLETFRSLSFAHLALGKPNSLSNATKEARGLKLKPSDLSLSRRATRPTGACSRSAPAPCPKVLLQGCS